MSESGRVRKGGGKSPQSEEELESDSQKGDKDVLEDVDELLDEIDDVLEENAEEFVRGYVQKGGQ